jgi:hypothetical protein
MDIDFSNITKYQCAYSFLIGFGGYSNYKEDKDGLMLAPLIIEFSKGNIREIDIAAKGSSVPCNFIANTEEQITYKEFMGIINNSVYGKKALIQCVFTEQTSTMQTLKFKDKI